MSKPHVTSKVRIYKTADEALEAANKEVARLQYEWDMQRYSAFGVPIDPNRLNPPKQFAYEKQQVEEKSTGWLHDMALQRGDIVHLQCGAACAVAGIRDDHYEYPLIVDIGGYTVYYDFDGMPENDSLFAALVDLGRSRNSKASQYRIVGAGGKKPVEDKSATDLNVESVDQRADWPETLKPDWEAVGVERDGSIAPVDELSYMQPSNPARCNEPQGLVVKSDYDATPTISEPVIEGGDCSVRLNGFLTEPIYVGLGAEITE